MIWLRKYQNDTQANSTPQTITQYFQDGTESFEEYYTRICNSPNESKDDIIFHLDQLIDIAIHCKLLSDWFSKLTQKERINYFLQLDSIDFIKENADYHYHFSQNRLAEAGEKVIAILNNSYNEFTAEFCKKITPYVNDVAKLGLFKPKYPTTCFWISYILQSNLLTHIRLSPRPYVIYQHDNCNFFSDVPDFVNYPLFRVDDNYQPKETIEDTTIELQNLSNECFDDFMKLAMFYVYKNQGAKSEQVTINIQQNINNPEFNYKTYSNTYHNETFNFESDKISNSPEISTDDIKELMFKKLQNNSGYKVLKAHLDQTDIYFKIFFELGYISYLNDVIEFNSPFSQGAFAEFIKDNDFLFCEIQARIPDTAFKELTGRTFNGLEQRSDKVKKYDDVKKALLLKNPPLSHK